MLLMFCRRNKGNKKGRNPSEDTDLNLCMDEKVLPDSNNYFSTFIRIIVNDIGANS